MKEANKKLEDMFMERDVTCKRCGKKCKIFKGGKAEYCGDCKFENFIMLIEGKLK